MLDKVLKAPLSTVVCLSPLIVDIKQGYVVTTRVKEILPRCVSMNDLVLGSVEDGGVVAAGAITEPNTVVAAGMIWSGNPARQSRPLSEENAKLFSIGVDVYKLYTKNYNAQS